MLRKSLGVEERALQPGFDAPAIRTRRVVFIGLDQLGMTMASRLGNAGHRLTVYDPAHEIEALPFAGWTVANSIEDACNSADAVFTMLPDDETAEAMILGPGGVVDSLPRRTIHIGSSTVSVACSDRIVEAHWDAGRRYVSAPVLLRSESTAEEHLLVLAGGHEATIIGIEPLLSPIGQLVRFPGWPSGANAVQLGAHSKGSTEFLVRHLELRARQDRSQGAGTAHFGRLLDIEAKGVLQ